MAQQLIQTGLSANDGTGDTLRIAGTKINENFTELYDSVYTLPTAGVGSGGTLGGVKVDGTTITVNNGIITANYTPYTLPTAGVGSGGTLGGVKVDGTTITIASGVITANYTPYTLPTAGEGSGGILGGVKVDGSTITITNGIISSQASLASRTTISVTSTTLTAGASGTYSVAGFKSYILFKITTSAAAWVTLYTDTASRTADSSRLQTSDPAPGSGVIAEVITTGSQTVLISPGTIGFNNESSPTTNIPIKIVNTGVVSADITVTLTLLKIED